MSIIHDALKKVQTAGQQPPEPLFSTPKPVESLTETVEKIAQQKPPIKNKLQSMYIITCSVLITLAITIASFEYICQQYQANIPQVKNFAKNSLYQLIHRKKLPSLKPLTPDQPKPLAQLTIKQATPITLNIHGIMANPSGNLVLIDDQVYQEGDVIDGAKIIKINLDSITINNNGTEQTIPVNS